MKKHMKKAALTLAFAGAFGITAYAAENLSQIPTSGEKVDGAPAAVRLSAPPGNAA